ncbi:hypothetical protein WA026_010598 [Henosepilachna vigintioctopunctata]|uniref:Uncharacterized protein n=1 Tax=Henosepilachna vigintioctopunctata TaxID=420089 RepID=A0AAW1VEW0_9CUCU
MRPYQKKNRIKNIHESNFIPHFIFPTLKIPIGPIWSDIKYIWLRDPPFPASIRLLLTVLLLCALIVPLLWILVPPILSMLFLYILYLGEYPKYGNWLEIPNVPSEEKKNMLKIVKEIFKRLMLRISIFVTLCDYVQIFRALGYINF